MKKITVFTPTYNRAFCLNTLYKSLCRQTSKDFCWLVIDDGSTDNTEELINIWINEKHIEIIYLYKNNGGMHTAHNLAYKSIQTELNICCDSDDHLTDNAIELIISKWKSVCNKNNIAGIIGLDAYINKEIVGTSIPSHLEKGNLVDLYSKHRVTGDKKLILRTEIVREYPAYPEFKNEKLVPLGVLYLMIGDKYDFIYSNEVYCIVEYLEDGSSRNIFRQYIKSPRGFAYARTVYKDYANSFSELLKNSIQIGSSAIFAKDLSLLNKGPKRLLNYLAFPLAGILSIYIKVKS